MLNDHFRRWPRRRTICAGAFLLGVAGVVAWITSLLANRLELQAYWEPFKESRHNFAREWSELRNLKPAKASAVYRQREFEVFLPSPQTSVGEPWELDGSRLLPFLKQFHPGATVELHHGSGSAAGAFACLRARNDRFDEIAFRVHAEFVMSDGQSFYTPAQFSGTLLFDRIARRVKRFHFYLPPRNTNIDVNRFFPIALVGDQQLEQVSAVDVGYSPRMELVGGDDQFDEIVWTESVSYDDANARLARRFYQFLEVRWRPWDEAVAESRSTGKPIHVVVLLGTLDDESC